MSSLLLKKIELDLAITMLQLLKDEKITKERAVEISDAVLFNLPESLPDDKIQDALSKISKKIPEFAPVTIKYLKEIDKLLSNQKLEDIKDKISKYLV